MVFSRSLFALVTHSSLPILTSSVVQTTSITLLLFKSASNFKRWMPKRKILQSHLTSNVKFKLVLILGWIFSYLFLNYVVWSSLKEWIYVNKIEYSFKFTVRSFLWPYFSLFGPVLIRIDKIVLIIDNNWLISLINHKFIKWYVIFHVLKFYAS